MCVCVGGGTARGGVSEVDHVPGKQHNVLLLADADADAAGAYAVLLIACAQRPNGFMAAHNRPSHNTAHTQITLPAFCCCCCPSPHASLLCGGWCHALYDTAHIHVNLRACP